MSDGNQYSLMIENKANKENNSAIVIWDKFEDEIKIVAEESDKKASLHEHEIKEASVNEIIKCSYKFLGLNSYFTAGPQVARM